MISLISENQYNISYHHPKLRIWDDFVLHRPSLLLECSTNKLFQALCVYIKANYTIKKYIANVEYATHQEVSTSIFIYSTRINIDNKAGPSKSLLRYKSSAIYPSKQKQNLWYGIAQIQIVKFEYIF